MKLNSKLGLIIASIIIVAALGTTIIYNAVSNNDNPDDKTNVEQNDNEDKGKDEETIDVVNLPNLKNKAQFVSLLKENQELQTMMYGVRNGGMMLDDGMVMEEAAMDTAASGTGDDGSADYSGTNNQVTGVDEGDSIKTDGNYFYKIAGYGESVQIIDANPDQMSVVQTIQLPVDHWVNSLFLTEGKLVLIANYYEYPEYEGEEKVEEDYMYDMIWYGGDEYTKVFVYDVSNVTVPILEQEYQFKGYYLSGRTIGDTLYFVTNEYMYYDWYRIFEEDMNIDDDMVLPSYKDCLTDEETELEYEDICYFPGAVEPSYMNTVAIDLSNPNQSPDFKSYLGSAYNVYVSTESLYTAVTEYTYEEASRDQWTYEVETTVYKFALEGATISPVDNATLPGSIVNQFSMDEHNGYFRIATTTADMWWDDQEESMNNLYILDSNMNQVGSVEGLAEGERIYSTRFMGDKVYMVTFKQVDPLFVIDTANPENPQVLGYLKIPGVSQYLHPIDENHLLGFGQDAVTEGDRTFLKGFKISLFDVTDPMNPIETQNEIIDGMGTYSELLYNHKALMYAPSKEMMAFPIQVTPEDDYMTNFMGGIVYHVNADGFGKIGMVTHITEMELTEDDYYYYDWDYMISRFIYIGDTLYSISEGMIQAHDMETLQVLSQVDLR